jgi:hypothetical protein
VGFSQDVIFRKMNFSNPIPGSKLGSLEQIWTKSLEKTKRNGEFLISGAAELHVQSKENLDAEFFENVFRRICAQHYRLCCYLAPPDKLKLAGSTLGEIPMNLKVVSGPFTKSDVNARLKRELNIRLLEKPRDLLWRSTVLVSRLSQLDWQVCVLFTFNHIMADGQATMCLAQSLMEAIDSELKSSAPLSPQTPILCRPPIAFEENVVPETCSFLPALWSLIRTQSFDPREGRFNGHHVPQTASMLDQEKTTFYDAFELDQEETAKLLKMTKFYGASVASSLIAACLSASRTIFELAKGDDFADIQDKQGFILPFDGRCLIDGVDPRNCVANYVVTSMNCDYQIVDGDQFWVHARAIRDYYRRDSRNFKGRVKLIADAVKGMPF